MNKTYSTFSLYTRAEYLHQELYNLVNQYGLNHPRVIQKRFELDNLLLELQRREPVINAGTVRRFEPVRAVRRKSRWLSLVERLIRKPERFITGVQEWLESKDSLPATTAWYSMIILSGIYIVSRLLVSLAG